MINSTNLCIFDFETSGLDPETDRIIEVAAIKVVAGKVVSEFSTLIQNGPVEPKITELTGITNDELPHGLKEKEALSVLNRLAHGCTLVAHNAAFDLAFYHHTLIRHEKPTLTHDFIDTMTISRERHVYPHRLENMCKRYGIELTGAHRALNDVYGCWNLLKALHDEESVENWVNKLGYLNKYGPNKWYPAHAHVFGTDNKYAS